MGTKAFVNIKVKEKDEDMDRVAGREDKKAREFARDTLKELGVTNFAKLPDETVQTGQGRLRFNVDATPGDALGLGADKGKTLDIEWRLNLKKIHGKDVVVDKELKTADGKVATVVQRTTLTDDKGQAYMVHQAVGKDGKLEGDPKYYKAKLSKNGYYEPDGAAIDKTKVTNLADLEKQHKTVAEKVGEKYSIETLDGSRIVADAGDAMKKGPEAKKVAAPSIMQS